MNLHATKAALKANITCRTKSANQATVPLPAPMLTFLNRVHFEMKSDWFWKVLKTTLIDGHFEIDLTGLKQNDNSN